MANRLSKIVTKTGDDGSTGLADGTRVSKNHSRVEAFGTLDELNSHIGLLLCESLPEKIASMLIKIQHELFDMGAELSIPGSEKITAAQVNRLEQELDALNEDLPYLKEFILPGGSRAASLCHVCRTVSRRAERALISCGEQDVLNGESLKYLNRLSDWLFVCSRCLNVESRHKEVFWSASHLKD